MILRSARSRPQFRPACAFFCPKQRGLHGDLKQRSTLEIINHVQSRIANEEYSSIKTFKNKLQRHYDSKYAGLLADMRCLGVMDEKLVKMIFMRRSGPTQHTAFVSSLESIKKGSNSVSEKRKRIYGIIKLQKALYPEIARTNGILVPETLHQWFWQNLRKDETFQHYYFLIQNDVLLSSKSSNLFLRRLLKGSEMEVQLGTFQVFLHNPEHHEIFQSKFEKLYNFSQINQIVTAVLARKDLRHIKLYFAALLNRLEGKELQNSDLSEKQRIALFIKFTNTLLNYLKLTCNYDMFLHSFKMVTDLVLAQKLDTRLLHKPFLLAIQYLRSLSQHSHVLKLISFAQELSLERSFKFKQSVIGELVSTMRAFNDPKIIVDYITTVYTSPKTLRLLNELGIWSLLRHNSVNVLNATQLERDFESNKIQKSHLSNFLAHRVLPNTVVLTELYRVILQYFSNGTPGTELKQLIIDLYHRYKACMINHEDYFVQPDCGIINVLIYHLRFQLKDHRLAFVLAQDFFQTQPFVKCDASTPFGLVLYHNHALTRTEISSLLVLMDKHKVKLDFKVISAMVFQNLRSGQIEEAHTWFQKLISAGFPLTHRSLIKCAIENDWELPRGIDTSFMTEAPTSVSNSGFEFEIDDAVSGGIMEEEEHESTVKFANALLGITETLAESKGTAGD
ncbi:Atp22 [Lachancea thermotolerans]